LVVCNILNIHIVGTPTAMISHRGNWMMFSRGEWEPTNKLKGLINPSQIIDLVASTISAIKMGAQEIHVAF
jgi:hypothetical protein